MTQLFDPVEHQPLDKRPWSESEARAVIAMLVDETVAAWHPQHWWPPHPDEDGVEDLAISEPHLYMGASGLVLALDFLRRNGYEGAVRFDTARAAETIAGDLSSDILEVPWYFAGSLGPIFVTAIISGTDDAKDRLESALLANLDSEADELFAGVPGGMLACRLMWERDGDVRWRELFLQGLERMWPRWIERDEAIFLWKNPLYGRPVTSYIGAGH